MAVRVALDIAGAGLDRRFEHLIGAADARRVGDLADMIEQKTDAVGLAKGAAGLCKGSAHLAGRAVAVIRQGLRSEEHTSELQSQSNLVCRLLLEKKKKT